MTDSEINAYNQAIEDCINLFILVIDGSENGESPDILREGLIFKPSKFKIIPSLKRNVLLSNKFGPYETINAINNWRHKVVKGIECLRIKGPDHIPVIKFHGMECRKIDNKFDTKFNISDTTRWSEIHGIINSSSPNTTL